MTIQHPVRRLLARVCSDDTMARVVDPTLADVRVEHGRATWRGCLTLVRALALHGATSLPDRMTRAWRGDDGALPRAAFASAATAMVLAIPLVAAPVAGSTWPGRVGPVRVVALLTPQALIVALPASLLVAIPLAFGRATPRRRIVVRSLGLAVVCAGITMVLLAFVMPESNQAFRVATSGRPDIARGPNEMGLGDLREQIAILNLTPGGPRAARPLEYAYQLKLAMSSIALPLGLLGAALTQSRRIRRHPVLAGTAAIVLYVYAIFWLDAVSTSLLKVPAVPAGLVAWLPTAAIVALAVLVFRKSRAEKAATA